MKPYPSLILAVFIGIGPLGAAPRFLDLSARAMLRQKQYFTAQPSAIIGITVTGPGSKRTLVRAVGPGLAPFMPAGIPLMSKPHIDAYDMSTSPPRLLVSSQPIGDLPVADQASIAAVTASVGAFAAGPGDAALDLYLPPGGWTFVVTDPVGGVGLLEAYDADPAGAAAITNISALGRSWWDQPGGSLIVGFVTTEPMQVLLRTAGPTLSAFNVLDTMPYPAFSLYAQQGSVQTLYAAPGGLVMTQGGAFTAAKWGLNASMAAFVADAMNRSGAFAFPTGSNDAAATATLPAGQWTVVSGSASGYLADDGKTVSVEAYKVP